MTKTWAGHLASSDRDWVAFVVIAGVGRALPPTDPEFEGPGVGQEGCWRICTQVPSYASGYYRAGLLESPDVLSERAKLAGGVPELGSLSFGVVDTDDWLTDLVRPSASPVASGYLIRSVPGSLPGFSLSGSTRDFTVSPLVAGEAVYGPLGVQASIVKSVSGSPTTTSIVCECERPVFRTLLRASSPDVTQGWLHLPQILGQPCWLYVGPADAADDSEEQLVGEYVIDSLSWDRPLNVWRFGARSQSSALQRLVPPEPVVWTVGDSGQLEAPDGEALSADGYVEVNGEVMINRSSSRLAPAERAQLGTRQADRIEAGMQARRVLTAGDFYSDHWVDILLGVLLSAPPGGDSLPGTLPSGYPNLAILPDGWGLGMSHDQIDYPSWWDARARTWDARFPWVAYGAHDQLPFAQWAAKNFLEPVGAFIIADLGKLRCVVPRLPFVGDAPPAVGLGEILQDHGEPRAEVSLYTSAAARQMTYEIGPQKQVVLHYDSAVFPQLNGYVTGYATPTPEQRYQVLYASPMRSAWTRQAALRQLYRIHRPVLSADLELDLGTWGDALIGANIAVTLDEAPNLDGTRGWSGLAMQVIEREPTLLDGGALKVKAIGYPGEGIAMIAPSAHVESVAGNDATVLANRYVVDDYGPSATDAAAFRLGDIVRVATRAGELYATTPPAQKITGIAGNVITLDGNFGGVLAADQVLIYADRAAASVTQVADFAFISATHSAADADIYGDA